jgi:hypothetical protein
MTTDAGTCAGASSNMPTDAGTTTPNGLAEPMQVRGIKPGPTPALGHSDDCLDDSPPLWA